MSVDLRAAAAEHLSDRAGRGYARGDRGWLIAGFLDRMAADGETTITVAAAVAYATAPQGVARRWHAVRLAVLRDFAAHVHAIDPASAEPIPAGLITARTVRRIPYLCTADQVAELMTRAARLHPPLLGASMSTLVGLLAAAGLRSGEALALDVEDLPGDDRVLTVTGKHGRRRPVPLHPSTIDALDGYLQRRAALGAPASAGPLLVGCRGGRLNSTTARAAFRAVVAECALPSRPGCRPPRLHDLRHRFAVDTLIDAHRDGADVDARIAALAHYLGHASPANTYWYLSASPELMRLVSDRMTTHQQRRQP